jgi:hypothetical protein
MAYPSHWRVKTVTSGPSDCVRWWGPRLYSSHGPFSGDRARRCCGEDPPIADEFCVPSGDGDGAEGRKTGGSEHGHAHPKPLGISAQGCGTDLSCRTVASAQNKCYCFGRIRSTSGPIRAALDFGQCLRAGVAAGVGLALWDLIQ